MTPRPVHRLAMRFAGVVLSLALAACGTVQRPSDGVRLVDAALTPAQDPRLTAGTGLVEFTETISARLADKGGIDVLALSGGGSNGAYGAGVLVGWSERGDRPEFDVVTGVSTGALVAPFAFLGPDWDDELQHAYTGGEAAGLVSWRSFAGFLNPSLFSSRVLRDLVDSNVSPELLAAVAREHARGRRLLVATTDLDSQQTVIWDMGQLASNGDNNSTRLFKDVLVASASIPGVFPPVFIGARDQGNRIVANMHVDGSVNTPFLAVPEDLMLMTVDASERHGGAIYVIVNGQVGRSDELTPGRVSSILSRSFDSMTKASLRMNLAMTTAFARRNGLSLSMTAMPDNISASGLSFAQETMQALFNVGRRRGADGSAWSRLDQQATDAPLVTRDELPAAEIPSVLEIRPAPGDAPSDTPPEA